MLRKWKNGDYDLSDPIDRAEFKLISGVIRIAILIVIWLCMTLWMGIPHIQTNFSHYQGITTRGMVSFADKPSANYWGLTGRRHVKAGQFGQPGCPIFLFIPVWDCLQDQK